VNAAEGMLYVVQMLGRWSVRVDENISLGDLLKSFVVSRFQRREDERETR
jgi:hypothetical protein